MKDHRRKQQQHHQRGDLLGSSGATWKGKLHPAGGVAWGRSSFWCKLTVLICCGLLSAFTFSAFRLFGVSFHPVLAATWQQTSVLNVLSSGGDVGDRSEAVSDRLLSSSVRILHAVSFPDQLLLFVNRTSRSSLSSSAPVAPRLQCFYSPSSSPGPKLRKSPIHVDLSHGVVRCPPRPHGFLVSLGEDGSDGTELPLHPLLPKRWDSLAYESLLDSRDNSTIVFVKGLNLRPERLSDASRYQCVFGWDFARPRYLITSSALTVAQEIVRCRTPLSVLRRHFGAAGRGKASSELHVMASVKASGRGAHIFPSVARPALLPGRNGRVRHRMCACTMVRNQARFITEWIKYHARIGVERWFIYDNNSNDNTEQVVQEMGEYNVSGHSWPWVKTQEAGFAHCALRARASCQWVAFIDVDEFLYLPSPKVSLHDVLKNYSSSSRWIAELRTVCHTFGPSGHRMAPKEGVTTAYTCRMAAPERHKSIVRPEALNPSLINVVHHFHLKDGYQYVNLDRGLMVINHYKYQAWEVFKEKFYRRVATYVADWQDEENAGSKDRAPGLGTKAVEPPDWPNRFCEVRDTGLRDRVLRVFADPSTGELPW